MAWQAWLGRQRLKSGRRGKGRGRGCKGFGSGGVGGRGTGPRDGANRTKRRKMAFLKDALWGAGGTHRSWPGGRGGRPRALIPGEGVREGLAWQAKPEHPATELAWWTGGQGGGARAQGGVQGLRFRGGRW